MASRVSDHPVCASAQSPLLCKEGIGDPLPLSFLAFPASAASDVANAAMQKNAQAVRTLLQQKADVNAPQSDGTTALHWAVRWDDLDMASTLIRSGANAQAANRDGATPMFLAAMNGSAAMIETLLKAGVDPNAPVLSRGETPLMMAARTGKLDAVRVLIERGAKVNAAESFRGTNALMWAAEQGHTDVVKLLLDKGAAINSASAVIRPIRRNGLGFARVAPGAEPNGDPMGGLTALLFAVRQGSLETVRTLVAAGANVTQAAVDESSPLLVAVQNGNYEIGRFLIDHGANVNQANSKGWTPLYLAVANRDALTTAVPPPSNEGSLDFIKLLLDRGATPNVRIKVKAEVHQANTSLWLKEAGRDTAVAGGALWRSHSGSAADRSRGRSSHRYIRQHDSIDGCLRSRLGGRFHIPVFGRHDCRVGEVPS